MRTFSIDTLGCKANQYESRQVRELLERLGMVEAGEGACADLAVVNTCCVTAAASAKSRRCVRKRARQKADATVVVAGCPPCAAVHEPGPVVPNTRVIEQRAALAAVLSEPAGGDGGFEPFAWLCRFAIFMQ